MSTVPTPPDQLLHRELEHAHACARGALAEPDADPLAAITWMSTHLAAVTRVVHPLARRLLPHGRARLHGVVSADRALQQALWRLDRRLTGDVHVSGLGVEALQGAVVGLIDTHERQERDLVGELSQHLTVGEQQDLALGLASLARRAPTRPHPDAPVQGLVAGFAFFVDAGADHLRDRLDNRSWPTPHDERAARSVGRWGSYLMAAPFPRDVPPR